MNNSPIKRPAPRAGLRGTIPKGGLLTIACSREVIAAHPVKTDYPAVFLRDR